MDYNQLLNLLNPIAKWLHIIAGMMTSCYKTVGHLPEAINHDTGRPNRIRLLGSKPTKKLGS